VREVREEEENVCGGGHDGGGGLQRGRDLERCDGVRGAHNRRRAGEGTPLLLTGTDGAVSKAMQQLTETQQ